MKILLPRTGGHQEGVVKGRKCYSKGYYIGKNDQNPYIDTSIYEVEFPYGNIWEYVTNTIVENLYSSVDDNGSTP